MGGAERKCVLVPFIRDTSFYNLDEIRASNVRTYVCMYFESGILELSVNEKRVQTVEYGATEMVAYNGMRRLTREKCSMSCSKPVRVHVPRRQNYWC